MSGIGSAIKKSRKDKHINQETVGNMGYCSGKLISAIERGERQITADVLKNITSGIDDPRVYMEAAKEITGGVFGVPWLDGECVDLHRASVKEKVLEEVSEAIAAINLVRIYDNPKVCKQDQIELVRKSVLEVIDAYVAEAHYIAIMCNEYGLSIKELFMEQHIKLQEHGYLKAQNNR